MSKASFLCYHIPMKSLLSYLYWSLGAVALYLLTFFLIELLTNVNPGFLLNIVFIHYLGVFLPLLNYIANPFIFFFAMFKLGQTFYSCVYLVVAVVYIKLIIHVVCLTYKKFNKSKVAIS